MILKARIGKYRIVVDRTVSNAVQGKTPTVEDPNNLYLVRVTLELKPEEDKKPKAKKAEKTASKRNKDDFFMPRGKK